MGYSSDGARPQKDIVLSVTRGVIDEDMEKDDTTNSSYFCNELENLIEVRATRPPRHANQHGTNTRKLHLVGDKISQPLL